MNPHQELGPGLYRFEKVLPSGWGLNMFVVRGRSGLVVHSPTWFGPGTFEALEALGAPSVLVAPNHFHHLSLPRYRERYPGARVVAAEGALPRLAKQGHQGVSKLEEASSELPEGARWLVPPGLKNGEAWLSLPGEGGPTWLTSDAFFNVQRPLTGLMGAVFKLTDTGPGLRLGRTFRLLAIRDKAAYRQWLLDALDRERPSRVLVSHGEPIGGDLRASLGALVRAKLG